jgi:serine/threonine protein kinase
VAQESGQSKLLNPFRGTVYLNHGGYGHIFRLPDTALVVKIAHRIVNGTAGEETRAAENLEILQRESAVYDAQATKPPHPIIVEYFLSTDIAIFMKFEPDNLKRLSRRSANPIPEERQFRWITQIASAASWLDTLDYFHGDLRPENILLDEAEHVKVCDFGRAQKRGSKVEVATYPFYSPLKNAVAGPAHEQFAIGSCIYTIRTGEVPYGQLETPEQFRRMYDALVQGEYPPTEDDDVLGHVVSSCWLSTYDSMKEVEAPTC